MSRPGDEFEFLSAHPRQTQGLAAALARCLPSPAVVALCGTLGAGKTYLVQSLAEALGVPRNQVVSPTFTIIQRHTGSVDLVHIDAYRIADEDEFFELGLEELFETHPGVLAIEWADRFTPLLPESRLDVEIAVQGQTHRLFRVRATGPDARLAQVLPCLRQLADEIPGAL